MKRGLLSVAAVLLLLAGLLGVRTLLFTSRQAEFAAGEPASSHPVDADAVAARLAESLTFRTVSLPPPAPPAAEAFQALHAWLETWYPLTHLRLEREIVGGHSLLYTWRGTDPSLPPVVLMGHLDVVPVTPGSEDAWTHPPFAGVVADGWVWGRGAMDDKVTVVSILEAVEGLLADGFRPARTLYLAFGHDEELGGEAGAARIADLLASRRVDDFALVLDEGGAITLGLMPGLDDRPAAIIGIAEKGYLSLRLTVEGRGGHSSTPPPSTAIGILARAVARLEDRPFELRIDGATRAMFDYIGREMPFGRRLVFANLWLFAPLVERTMSRSPESAAMLRTTTAVTMFDAGVKDNVLPNSASAVVNHRILPGDTVDSVTARVREIVADERIKIETAFEEGNDPSPVSSVDGASFRLVGRTLREVLPDEELVISPYLVIGGTDAKHYAGSSRNVFRFLPVFIGEGDLGRVHGTDERVSVESVALAVRYFRRLIEGTDGL